MSNSALREAGGERLVSRPGLTNFMTFVRRWGPAVALVVYTVMAFALFSATWVHPTTSSVGGIANTQPDSELVMGFLAWPPFAITRGHNLVFTNYLDYPSGVNLMWNVSMLLPGVVLAPLTQAMGVVLAYNVLMTVGLALSAWTAFLLIRRFVSSQVAAGVGGALYGFSPFMLGQSLAHPWMTVAFMAPVLLLLLDEIIRVQRRRPLISGLLLGVAAAAQVFIGEEVLATTAVTGFLLVCIAAALCRDQVGTHARRAVLGLASAAVTFGMVTVVPVAFQLFGPQHLRGTIQRPNIYASDALSFFIPSKLFALAPPPATAISHRFITGNLLENGSYVGVLLSVLLVFIAIRYWHRLEVKIAVLGAVLIAILSMGITIHFAGRNTPIPVFTLGLAFPILRRYLPGWLMLFLTFAGWLALAKVPVLNNMLPSRLMLYFFLLAGLLVAVWLDDMRAWQTRPRRLGWLALAASLVLLLPGLPYPSTPVVVPAFFEGGAASRIPVGSVALVIPYATRNDARAMVWQAETRMRFRMPEGYALNPQPLGALSSPPPSVTRTQTILVAVGRADPLTDTTRQQILGEIKSWQVETLIVGPMNNEQQEVDFFTSVLGRAPESVDGVYVWWAVDSGL
jgi:hypothetical protein